MMAVTGMLLLGFILFHLAHYTSHTVDPSFAGMYDEKGRHDVYRMVIEGFSNPLVSLFYIVGWLCCVRIFRTVRGAGCKRSVC
jgi:succinate dehydrogenase / fumarate reductase cytochrome b subunit